MVQLTGIIQKLVSDATFQRRTESAMPAVDDDTLFPFTLPNVCREKVAAAFDGGTISSDGGVLLLAGAEPRLGLVVALLSAFST